MVAAELHFHWSLEGSILRSNWDFRSAAQSALALILLALGLMVWDQEGGKQASLVHESHPNTFSRDTVATINKHLQWTEKRVELNTVAVDVDNQELASTPTIEASPVVLHMTMDPFATEDAAGQVLLELEPGRGHYDSPRLPAERITSIVEQKQWMKTYNKKQTEAFVRAVRENARNAGYQLEINDQLKVTNVRRMPNQIVDAVRPSGSR